MPPVQLGTSLVPPSRIRGNPRPRSNTVTDRECISWVEKRIREARKEGY